MAVNLGLTLAVCKAHLSGMENPPHFNFRDVLRAPASALSAKQILVMTLFLIGSLVVYDLFTYLAYAAQGERLSLVFDAYGFFPFSYADFHSFWPLLLYGVGVGLAVLILMAGFCGVAAINIEAIRGHRFLSARQAIRFSFQRLRQIFLAELSIAVFVIFIVFVFFLLGLISRIPVIGDWIYVLLFAVPNFIIALLSVFTVFVFTLTVLLLPAVAAAERHGETFTAILETFSTIILQPFRWAGYTLYAVVAAKVCGFIYAYFAYRAVQFLTWSTSLGGGRDITRLVRSGLSHLPVRSDLVRETFNLFPGVPFGVDLLRHVGYQSNAVLSHLMAFMLFLIFTSILGYMLAVVAAGQAHGYVALRHMKDGYSLADEPSLFFEDQPINEPVDEEESATSAEDTGVPW